MKTVIYTVFSSIDYLSGGINYVLGENNEVPSFSYTGGNIDELLKKNVKKYLQISPEWVQYELVGVFYSDEEVSIVYSSMIPQECKVKTKRIKSSRIDNLEMKDQRILYESGQKTC